MRKRHKQVVAKQTRGKLEYTCGRERAVLFTGEESDVESVADEAAVEFRMLLKGAK